MKHFFIGIFLLSVTVAYSQKASFKVQVYGKGQPVILIPGLGCSGDVWKETVENFKDKYQLYVLTLPGFAGVSPIDTPILKTVKDQLISFILEKKLSRPIIIGHSLGGFLSLWAASEEPDLFSKVITVDGYPFLPEAFNPGITEQQIKTDSNYNVNSIADKYVSMPEQAFADSRIKTALWMVKDSAHAKMIAKWSMQSDRKTLAYTYVEMCSKDLRKDIAYIDIPVLVLGATYSTKDGTKKMLEEQFKNVRNKIIEVAPTKHFIMYDDPAWFKEQVKNFLANGLYN